MTRLPLILAVTLAGLGAVAGAQQVLGPSGYLKPDAFDVLAILPPAPKSTDPRGLADRAIFKATRALQGSPRWAMATSDVKSAPVDLFRDFSCAMGIAMTPENAPRTAALLRRAMFDTGRQTGIAKTFYKRQRPFLIDRGPICQPAAEVADSYDYPSGHTTAGWTMATVLAQIAPDRATALLARGRAYGESRIVCGVHNASAVDAGRLSASSTLTAMQGDPAFTTDLAAARQEIAALRQPGGAAKPDTAQCTREAALVAQPLY
ncbi:MULTISPECIES: phosphatase PAP2 family protein [unclassified Sphingomonas]|uniref:acid phosphatase n=1 Tax=unclassified Sphingomonas TaxID=196159 RepID=UPI000E71B2D0|nr:MULTISPECIES: phosphatase PAP2 family protein [unclassified Sphingomonas]RKE47264.1 acid phosphatase (class A) [Sphingomonas sp. PP-CC-1A-547]TCM07710.1 acid phosphatase (class A) [Sphingomonas sp. PP-CC-3G-468]